MLSVNLGFNNVEKRKKKMEYTWNEGFKSGTILKWIADYGWAFFSSEDILVTSLVYMNYLIPVAEVPEGTDTSAVFIKE